MKLHLAGGQKYLDGWTNVDWTTRYKVDICANILKPEFWMTIPSDSVSSILCEHFIEHIPHELRHTDQDGLIWFFEELYRVCRDGSLVEVAFPHYQGSWAYGDPTHCRFVQAMTLRYFDRVQAKHGPMPDYGLNCDFEVVQATLKFVGEDIEDGPTLRERINREWNHIYEERVILKAHKPLREPL